MELNSRSIMIYGFTVIYIIFSIQQKLIVLASILYAINAKTENKAIAADDEDNDAKKKRKTNLW